MTEASSIQVIGTLIVLMAVVFSWLGLKDVRKGKVYLTGPALFLGLLTSGDTSTHGITTKAEKQNDPDLFVLIVIVNIFSSAAVFLVGALLILVGYMG